MITPFQYTKVNNNKLIAEGEPEFIDNTLCGGAIHCYKRYETANDMSWFYNRMRLYGDNYVVKKCYGKGFIAHNNREIAFKEITILDD